MITVPFLKSFEFFTLPVRLPSLFCLNEEIMGTLEAGALAFAPPPPNREKVGDGLAACLGGGVDTFLAGATFLGDPPPKEKVGEGFGFDTFGAGATAFAAFFGAAALGDAPPPPKSEKGGLFPFATGGAGVSSFGSVFFGSDDPNKEKVLARFAGLGAADREMVPFAAALGAGVAFFAAGFGFGATGELPPKKPPKVAGFGDGLLTTAFVAAGAAFLTGAAFFTGAGLLMAFVAAGAAFFAGAGFGFAPPPPNKLNVPLPLLTAFAGTGGGATGAGAGLD